MYHSVSRQPSVCSGNFPSDGQLQTARTTNSSLALDYAVNVHFSANTYIYYLGTSFLLSQLSFCDSDLLELDFFFCAAIDGMIFLIRLEF